MGKLRAGSPVFNVCTGSATSILDLAQTMAHVMGAKLRLRHLPKRTGDIDASIGDPSEARRALGICAAISLPDGIRQALASVDRVASAATPAKRSRS